MIDMTVEEKDSVKILIGLESGICGAHMTKGMTYTEILESYNQNKEELLKIINSKEFIELMKRENLKLNFPP